MNLISKAFKHLLNRTFILGLKNQPARFRKWRWDKFKKSKKKFCLFNHRNIFKIVLYKDSELSQYIFQKNFEVNEINFINDFINPNDVIIDIGSNIGFFSLLAAKRATIKGHVFSFEPTNQTYERLRENIALNRIKNITAIKKGVSNENGFLELHTSQDGYDAWNSFARPICGDIFEKEMVETIKLDDFIFETKIADRISLIKIDVEGWEKFVVLGGVQFLSKNQKAVLLIEFVDQHARNAGYTCNELFQLLVSYGYTLYNIKNKILEKEPIRDIYYYSNLVITKNPEVLKRRLQNWKIHD